MCNNEICCCTQGRIGKDLLGRVARHNVPAKRYLVSVDQEFHDGLADDSRRSLMFQGGVMTREEVAEFSSDAELRDLKLEFRTWDEKGKAPGAKTPPLEFFMPMVERHLKGRMLEKYQ